MALATLTREDAAMRLAQVAGEPETVEALSELIRGEVHARGHAPRAVTLSRVARLLTPVVNVTTERLEQTCDALEREGDVVLTPGGVLHATPTRVVALERRARVFGSVPTRVLAVALGRNVAAAGAGRTVAAAADLADAVAKVGGAIITPESWAGLDHTPMADPAFLEALDQRLEWEPLPATALEKDGALEWRTWEPTGEGGRWRRGNEGRLWWARARFGGHHRAWTAGGPPTTKPFVELRADDADRARFALSRDVVGASVLRVERAGTHVTLEVPGWLPRPEYRWLSLHAEPVPESKGRRWVITAHQEVPVTKLLTERLGLIVEAS